MVYATIMIYVVCYACHKKTVTSIKNKMCSQKCNYCNINTCIVVLVTEDCENWCCV